MLVLVTQNVLLHSAFTGPHSHTHHLVSLNSMHPVTHGMHSALIALLQRIDLFMA